MVFVRRSHPVFRILSLYLDRRDSDKSRSAIKGEGQNLLFKYLPPRVVAANAEQFLDGKTSVEWEIEREVRRGMSHVAHQQRTDVEHVTVEVKLVESTLISPAGRVGA